MLPVVGLKEFFDGNTDQYSIAAMLVGFGHPGLEEFYRILRAVKREPTVQDVLIAIHETPYPEDPEDAAIWPDSDTVYVLTSAPAEEVATWVRPLRVDNIGEGWVDGIKRRLLRAPAWHEGACVMVGLNCGKTPNAPRISNARPRRKRT